MVTSHTHTTTPIPIVLDVDTGVDDACALLLAALHPGLDLRAVSCVGGNAPVDDVVRNTLVVLEAAGRADVPVARGAGRPLLEKPVDARHVHGDDGMGDLGWPPAQAQPDPRHAVELLRDVCREAVVTGRAVTLVPLAPLTNIALLLRTYPEVAEGISEIVFMGGAANVGNATASAEFNVFHDPEAAAIALDAAADLGIPVTMYGLDVFYEPVITREEAAELVAVGGRGAAELGGLLLQFQHERFGRDASTIGDAGAVCAVIDRASLTTEELPLRVELAGTWSRGRTIVDRRDWSGDMAHDPHGEAPVRAARRAGRRRRRLRAAVARHAAGPAGRRLMGRVAVLGSLNVDVVTLVERHPRPGETVLGRAGGRFAGGKGGNQAVAAARAGAEVAMLARVGDDDAGTSYRRRLERLGIDVRRHVDEQVRAHRDRTHHRRRRRRELDRRRRRRQR